MPGRFIRYNIFLPAHTAKPAVYFGIAIKAIGFFPLF